MSEIQKFHYVRDKNGVTKQVEDLTALKSAISMRYEDLVYQRDNNSLTPGQWYRITDYVTTTIQEDTMSAGHQFDILVRADDVNILNENCYAALHDGDTYFANSKLEAWELKYCLDNDTNRFEWASLSDAILIDGRWYLSDPSSESYGSTYPYAFKNGSTVYYSDMVMTAAGSTVYQNPDGTGTTATVEAWQYAGTGVIYYMKDENGNILPYDFKNIMFKRPLLAGRAGLVMLAEYRQEATYDAEAVMAMSVIATQLGTSRSAGNVGYYHSLGVGSSVAGSTLTGSYVDYAGNAATIDTSATYILMYSVSSKNIYCKATSFSYRYTFDYNATQDMSLKAWTYDNTMEMYGGSGGTKRKLNNNVFVHYNATQYPVYGNHFATDCYNNTFSNRTYLNTFGNNVRNNTFGNNVQYNTFGNNLLYNTFGNYVYYNTFGNYVNYNTFGNNVRYNTFGNNVYGNTFGNYVQNNTFGNYVNYNTFGNYVQYNTFGNNVYRNTFGNSVYYNTFGNYVQYVVYGQSVMSLGKYFYYNIIENGNQYLTINCTQTTSASALCQNIKIAQGVNNSTTPKTLTVDVVNNTYQIEFKPADSEVRSV